MDRIKFKVNGVQHSVGCEVSSTVTLVDYLRDVLELRGTKFMCREGGCGACIVAAVKSPGGPTLAVNSCMVAITSCQDWEITTIEELGNRKKGYHILQKTLAEYNGTQCGYCSPAWIMNLYSLLQNSNKPTMLEIEQSFGGNVCRCTGYRPILDAFKNFARDAPNNDKLMDIEDLTICKRRGENCKTIDGKSKCDENDWCILDVEDDKDNQIILKDNKCWYKVKDLSSVFKILRDKRLDSYMLVFGNTAKGAYPIEEYPNTLIDISSIPELKVVNMDQNLVVGAGLTLTELLDTFKKNSEKEYFGYLKELYDHLKLVAHIPVRNIGSVGGNLMIKHKHNDFQSDIYLMFETVGAYLTIESSGSVTKKLTMQEFLKEHMRGKVIINALLPPLSNEYKIYTYKVMPRFQNAHAIVNCGFLYKLTSCNRVLEARIVYGGLSPKFVRAKNTERFLVGKSLFCNETLQSALKVLEKELIVTENLPEPSVEYRQHLALALFYKGLLSLCPGSVLNRKYLTEKDKIRKTRPVSKAKQVYHTDPTLWPLNQPIPKVEALIQCAGETKYSNDIPTQPYEVYAAFALTTVAVGEIDCIDASKALDYPGVLAFYSAKDIPGLNSFVPIYPIFYLANEEVLCSGNVQYYNQPYGIVVAETQRVAEVAAKMVKVTYKNIKTPIIDVKEAVKYPSRLKPSSSIEATDKGNDVTKVIKGNATIRGQYHFMLENISCLTTPTEEGLAVYLTTHWMDASQNMMSQALNIQENKIDVHIRRLGGSFGFKISRPTRVAICSGLVTLKLNRPCRFVVPLTTTTRAMGKRLPCHIEYLCKVNNLGVIQNLDYTMYQDTGFKITEDFNLLVRNGSYYNCYNSSRWNFKSFDTITDTAKNTWCRGPGNLEAVAMAETIIERISYELEIDPFEARLANLDVTKFKDLLEMADTIKRTSSYAERKVAVTEFNKCNRWKKRGLRCAFLRWTAGGNLILYINLAVFHDDGTVVITHGGVEMGQGINTKAVQIAAYILGIPISLIQIKPLSTYNSPNCYITGGSVGSQNAGVGVRYCCEELLLRLKPIRDKMENPTWKELIKQAYYAGVDLQVHKYVGPKEEIYYDLYGVAVAETEVDILTGEFQIRRVDILQDVGQSVSPEIDIGQVEGAFIMGQGYWTSENLVYDKTTGELLTNRTWNYYVPLASDIPQDFRVAFRNKSYSLPIFLGAKSIGEPPICLAAVIMFALRAAMVEARKDSGIPNINWFNIDGACTVEKVALLSASKITDYLFY